MKQVIQSLKTGVINVVDVPVPRVLDGSLLIKSTYSLISPGTERMLLEFGKASWIEKARKQPDKVRMVIQKILKDGIQETFKVVKNKLDQPFSLGYCNVGRVVEIGAYVDGYKIGDRVISNGKHAEVNNVPINLSMKVPDNVSDQEASFTVLGSIALQGTRLLQPTLGETVVVIGLGLVGLLTVQILLANGCRVLGLDFDSTKTELAKQFGAETILVNTKNDPVNTAIHYSRGRGVDGVIITAATTSSEPIRQAAQMCRKRGRIILVGVSGLEFSRNDFFEKELTFQVSASYGPGRYDLNYEEKGQDYPLGFVRWTLRRNFEAVLDMISNGSIKVKSLISNYFSIEDAQQAYNYIENNKSSLGILFKYSDNKLSKNSHSMEICEYEKILSKNKILPQKISNSVVSFIGSGSYANNLLIPTFKKAGVKLYTIASNNGISSLYTGKRFRFHKATTNVKSIFSDNITNIVVITTRHDSHAYFVLKALASGKHVFVEKPLCLTLEELNKIKNFYLNLGPKKNKPYLMIGYNRRFAPHIKKIKSLLENNNSPKSFILTVNAGDIPFNHWTQDNKIGGGRIIGEACHFIDILRFLAGSRIKSWSCSAMRASINDTVTINLGFEDGTIGTIHYFANGNKSFSKERLEVFSNGRILQLDNYYRLTGFGWNGFSKFNLWRQDKGQKNCVKEFIQALQKGYPQPIPLEEIFETSQVTIEVSKCKIF